jgi:Holliday junction resolvase RusA-like endonuclease
MRSISFSASGEPKATPRVKACRIGGFTRVYTPATADDWKTIVRYACLEKWDKKPLVGPLKIQISFYLKRPKSHFRSNGERKPNAPRYHTSKPDIDNLTKAVLDALTNLGVWQDDKQIASCNVVKFYGVEMHGCVVIIDELE